MIRRPPRSTLTHSFPTRRSSDLGAIGAFREAVLQQASTSLTKERGGRCFDLSFDTACPERMFPYEIYDDGETIDRHRETGHFADFDRQPSAERDGTTALLGASQTVASWKPHRLTGRSREPWHEQYPYIDLLNSRPPRLQSLHHTTP